ncbi:MAG: hypothetical protein JNG82_03215 [Opitutaceae bacterium]|nr:hypothetical protein [Opitutaceae bacterium]
MTDWAVSRAYTGAGQPECFKGHPELAVPFVAAISSAIREKQLHRAVLEAIMVREQATEPAYDEAGGPDYLHLREAMEAAQNEYFEASRPLRRGEPAQTDVASAQARMVQLQADFDRTREQHAEFVQSARSAAARQYWSKRPIRGLPDTFFAEAPFAAPASRLARIHPVWWGGFFGRLQQALAFGHPAEGELLDRLPGLRKAATKKTLAAVIDEWRAEHNDQWGWYGEVHYRMLALRAAKKAACLTHWFNARAPGYLTSEARRFALQLDLAEHLAQVDPWIVPARHAQAALSEHGPN